MTMTRQHFQLIADQIKYQVKLYKPGSYTTAVLEWADTLSQTNPDFDRNKFLAACEITS